MSGQADFFYQFIFLRGRNIHVFTSSNCSISGSLSVPINFIVSRFRGDSCGKCLDTSNDLNRTLLCGVRAIEVAGLVRFVTCMALRLRNLGFCPHRHVASFPAQPITAYWKRYPYYTCNAFVSNMGTPVLA